MFDFSEDILYVYGSGCNLRKRVFTVLALQNRGHASGDECRPSAAIEPRPAGRFVYSLDSASGVEYGQISLGMC